YCDYDIPDLCDKFYSGDRLDAPASDYWHYSDRVPNRSHVESDSLGNAVGLVYSTTRLQNPCGCASAQAEANARNFATYLKAFALVYILPEVDWTAEKIDMLLQEGDNLFADSSEMEGSSPDPQLRQPDIYTDDEKRINRVFNLEGHTFTLALEPRYQGDPSEPHERQPSHIIKNLRSVLLTFFRTGRYCMLLTRVGHLLIWRRRKAFFVLDVKGRRKDDLVAVKMDGVAMLVCLKSVDNVVHLATNLSGITEDDSFTIRELVVVRLETPDGRIFMRDTSHRSIEFKVVNKNYAYLKGSLHLSLNKEELLRNRSSLMVAVASIMASKIDHPANWNTNMLDRLIGYGVHLCRSCWSDCLQDRRPIDLDTFPTQLRMGQFVLELKLLPNVRTGHWKCGVRVIGTDFEYHVRETLAEYGNMVFQINDQMYALWTKDEFYYLLDPYRHTIVGTHVAADQAKDAKWATVRMFRDQLTMLSVFHQMLKESNRQSAYYLHVVRIRNLAECPKGFALAPMPEDVDCLDVQSLNETILFNEQLSVSVGDKSLGDVSDYEEDLISHTEDQFDIEKFRLLTDRQIAGAEDEPEEQMEEMKPKVGPSKTRLRDRSRSIAVRKQASLKKISPKASPAKAKEKEKTEISYGTLNRMPSGAALQLPVQAAAPIQRSSVLKKPANSVVKKDAPKKVVAFGGTAPPKPNQTKTSIEDVRNVKVTPAKTTAMPFKSRDNSNKKIWKQNLNENVGRGNSAKEVGPKVATANKALTSINKAVTSINKAVTNNIKPAGKSLVPKNNPAKVLTQKDSPIKDAKTKKENPKRSPSPRKIDSPGYYTPRGSLNEEESPAAEVLPAEGPEKIDTPKDTPKQFYDEESKKMIEKSFKHLLLETLATSCLSAPTAKISETSQKKPPDSAVPEESKGRKRESSGQCKPIKSEKKAPVQSARTSDRFPGFSSTPQVLAVAGSESGTVESLSRLLTSSFKVVNRVLMMTPWGNYVIFRHHPNNVAKSAAAWFYVFDGCTCEIDRFRHLDLSKGTAGLLAFRKQSEVVCHIIDSREQKALQMLHTRKYECPSDRVKKLMSC
ncbi:hypothetical protein KR018_005254, partial [Drosophila ironensis]